MSWNAEFSKLRNILVELYPTENDARIVVDQAEIPPGGINFDGSAKNFWHHIIKEGLRRKKVDNIVQVALEDYPDRADLKGLYVTATSKQPLVPVRNVYINNLKALLSEGATSAALEELKKVVDNVDSSLSDQVLLVNARLASLTQDKGKGIISDEFYFMQRAQINHAALNIINKVSPEDQMRASKVILNEEAANLITMQPNELEKVIGGKEELMDINWLERAINASRCVCKVQLKNGGAGTGFLLNNGYLLTNNHVLETADAAKSARLIFNYQTDLDGLLVPTENYDMDSSVFYTSKSLDYTLVKIADPEDKLIERGCLKLEKFLDAAIDERVNIIQHPEGKTMKIALPDKIISVWKHYLFYLADTKPGSSGSPVFNQEWKVIGLHHAGRNEHDYQGGLQINEAGDIKPSNRGILIKDILEDLKKVQKVDANILSEF